LSSSSNATTKKQHIEKFKGKFDEVDGGCTVIHTKSIQLITNPINLAVYLYLASKPPEWKLNVKDIMNQFSIGKNKVYRAIADLVLIGLIERVETRDKGRFLEYQYFVRLSPLPGNREPVEPVPEIPLPGSPLPENRETYKEEKLPYKKERVKKDDSLSKPRKPKTPSIEDQQQYKYFLAKGFEIPKQYRHVKEWLEHQTKQAYH